MKLQFFTFCLFMLTVFCLNAQNNSFPTSGSVGIGGDPFDGIKTYIFQGGTTAPSYGSAALAAFNGISHIKWRTK